jgi:hypothetical protein
VGRLDLIWKVILGDWAMFCEDCSGFWEFLAPELTRDILSDWNILGVGDKGGKEGIMEREAGEFAGGSGIMLDLKITALTRDESRLQWLPCRDW